MKTNQDRKTLLFAAGGVTGLIAVTMLALGIGFNNFASAQSPTAAAVPMTEMIAPTSTPAAPVVANDPLAQVLDQNAQLRQAVTLMQEREAIYRQQLEQASQSLQAQQATPVQSAAGWAGESMDDSNGDEEHEAYADDNEDHDEDAAESHEHEEREHDDD